MKIFNVISLVLKGVPFRLPKGMNWNEINVPAFPFLFSLISGIAFATIPFRITKGVLIQKGCSENQMIQSLLLSMFSYSTVFMVFNGLILLFALGLLKQFRKAARVLYFSVFFQMIIMLLLFLSDTGILYSSAFIVIALFILRLFTAFIIMWRESSNNFLSLLYAFLCLDAWFMLSVIV